jgi:hypothetical protein
MLHRITLAIDRTHVLVSANSVLADGSIAGEKMVPFPPRQNCLHFCQILSNERSGHVRVMEL